MADDDTSGGTVLNLNRLRIPGVVGADPPPSTDEFPILAPLAELAPPASLSVEDGPDLSGNFAAGNHEAGIGDDSSSASRGVAAMSTVMMAGIAVAAMRGAYHAATYLKARADHHRAIADKQAAEAGKAEMGLEKARMAAESARRPSRVQSGPEFGRWARNSSAPAGRSNAARNSAPAPFRSGPAARPAPGGAPKAPGKAPGGPSAAGSSRIGAPVSSRGPEPRRRAPEAPAGRGGAGGNSGIGSAVRDRVAGRIRTGPQPRPDRGPGIRDAARGRVADRIRTGSWAPTSTGPKPLNPTKPRGAAADTIRGALRGRVTDRIRTGSWTPAAGAPKPVSLTKTTGAAANTIRGALRERVVNRIRSGRRQGQPPGGGAASGQQGPNAAGRPGNANPAGPGGQPGQASGRPKPPLRVHFVGGAVGARPWHGRGGGTRPGGNAGHRGPRHGQGQQGWWVRAGARRQARGAPGPGGQQQPGGGPAGARQAPGAGPRSQQQPPPGPGPGGGGTAGGGFGPPPGWGYATPTVITVEQVGGAAYRARPQQPAGITRGRAALAAGGRMPSPTRSGVPVTVPVPTRAPNTQYADSELTIYDVIDSDADMAEEILQGSDDARRAAEGCEVLISRLEALHAKIQELKVPGVLEGLVHLLAEKALNVKAKAEAVAEKLPAASEAIANAGANAEQRHRPLADAVRDAGHAAPAERDYHDE